MRSSELTKFMDSQDGQGYRQYKDADEDEELCLTIYGDVAEHFMTFVLEHLL